MRGDLPGFVDDALRWRQAPPPMTALRLAKVAALLDRQRVAVSNRHVLHGDAQLVGHHLRKDGLMS